MTWPHSGTSAIIGHPILALVPIWGGCQFGVTTLSTSSSTGHPVPALGAPFWHSTSVLHLVPVWGTPYWHGVSMGTCTSQFQHWASANWGANIYIPNPCRIYTDLFCFIFGWKGLHFSSILILPLKIINKTLTIYQHNKPQHISLQNIYIIFFYLQTA
jgi:hypothetical protein